jgi:hypothetical protein
VIEPRSLMTGANRWIIGSVELCMNAVRLQALHILFFSIEHQCLNPWYVTYSRFKFECEFDELFRLKMHGIRKYLLFSSRERFLARKVKALNSEINPHIFFASLQNLLIKGF